MSEMEQLFQMQYAREYRMRKILTIILSSMAIFFSFYGRFINGENSCMFIICLAFFVFTIWPIPKNWRKFVLRDSRRPIYGPIKCVLALIALLVNSITVNWAPLSSFGLLLAIYGVAITPKLKMTKK